jgi:hypothetical protein
MLHLTGKKGATKVQCIVKQIMTQPSNTKGNLSIVLMSYSLVYSLLLTIA